MSILHIENNNNLLCNMQIWEHMRCLLGIRIWNADTQIATFNSNLHSCLIHQTYGSS